MGKAPTRICSLSGRVEYPSQCCSHAKVQTIHTGKKEKEDIVLKPFHARETVIRRMETINVTEAGTDFICQNPRTHTACIGAVKAASTEEINKALKLSNRQVVFCKKLEKVMKEK